MVWLKLAHQTTKPTIKSFGIPAEPGCLNRRQNMKITKSMKTESHKK